MARLTNWRTKLQNYLTTNQFREFEPGVWDCSLFSADCVLEMTGVDPAASYRGQYSTVEAGLALLQTNGFADHEDFVAQNFTETPVLTARVGDLAVVEQRGQVGVGVVIGQSVALVTLSSGIGHVPLTRARRAFRVD